ncbi:hypothetical protein C2G38_2051377 [Gigaspora rosea]|uniref:Uncharacterized protein n=1 Tax=Gigaspora rosea TaxID=44941 RepID=A0A397TSN1_9GLOM|nr:hypothetical protein C2G38_2051377 [Gigaspora rosea]
MTRESLLRKAERQLSSNDIIKGALTYLKSTESFLNRQRRRNEISEENYKFRTGEIKYFRTTIERLVIEIKNLKEEINKLKNENQGLQDEINKLKNENLDLHEEMNNFSQNFGLIHLDENKGVLLGIKKQKMINALKEIRKQLDLYKNKYKPELSGLEARVLYEYKKCLYCNKEFIDPVIIYDLKIKICRQCIVDALISRKEFEKNYLPDDVNPIHKEAIIKAIYSVDFMQLQGSYLSFNFRCNEISEENYKFRTGEIKYFRTTIERLVIEIKNLKEEINKLKNENQGLQDEINKLKNENLDLHEEMNNLSQNFGLIHLDENKGVLLGIKKQKMINALKEIRKQLDLYKNKYKPELSELEARVLYEYKKCLYCNKEFIDPVIIYELKIKICRQCIVDALISHEEFEKN